MLGWHDFLGSSLKHLNDNLSSAIGSFGVPSVICHKHAFNDNVDLTSRASSNKKTKTNNIEMLSASIRKCEASLVEVAQITASQAHQESGLAMIIHFVTQGETFSLVWLMKKLKE